MSMSQNNKAYFLLRKQKHQMLILCWKKMILLLLVIISLFGLSQKTFAATYFFTSNAGADPSNTINWWVNSNGTGAHPANFTTDLDVFNIRPAAVAVQGANWAIGASGGGGRSVTLNDSGSLTINSGFTLSIAGKNTSSSDLFVYGTIIFQATGRVNLTVNNTSCTFNLMAGGTVKTANTTGMFDATIANGNCSIIRAGTAAPVNFNAASNYEYNGTGTQPLTGLPAVMNNLALSNTASVTTIASYTINGTLTIGNGTTFTAAAFDVTVAGTTTVGAGTSGVFTISSATGAKTFNGDVIVNAGATWNNTAANEAVTIAGSITNSGTFNAGTGIYTLSGTTKTITGTLSIPNVTVSGTYQNNGTLTVSTALSGSGTLTQNTSANLNIRGTSGITNLVATATNNTVNFNGTTAQNIPGVNYFNLTISGNKGTGAITFANGGTIGVAGIFSPTATNTSYVVTGNTFDYNGSGAQTITGNSAPFTSYNILVISNSGIKTITNGAFVTAFTFSINGSASLTLPNTVNTLTVVQ